MSSDWPFGIGKISAYNLRYHLELDYNKYAVSGALLTETKYMLLLEQGFKLELRLYDVKWENTVSRNGHFMFFIVCAFRVNAMRWNYTRTFANLRHLVLREIMYEKRIV